MIGVCRDRSRSLINLAVSNPSTPGMCTSRRMAAKSSFNTHCRASSPEFARTTFCVALSRSSCRAKRLLESSSTIKMLACDKLVSTAPLRHAAKGVLFQQAPTELGLAARPLLRPALGEASDHADFGQREAVEGARVGRGVGAGVPEVNIVALLKIGRERLVAHHHVDRIAGGSGNVPGNVRPPAVGADLVLEPFGRLDDAGAKPGVHM